MDYTTTCPQNYKFTGYERDAETGLDYAFARYYNDRLGRFMSGDPAPGDMADPQALNRYAYVRNNPTNLTDPFGRCPLGSYTIQVGDFIQVVVIDDGLPCSGQTTDTNDDEGCILGPFACYGSALEDPLIGINYNWDAPPQPPPLNPAKKNPPKPKAPNNPNSGCLSSAEANFALHAGVDAVGFVGAFLPGGTALSATVNGLAATSGFGLAAMDLPGNPQGAGVGALTATGGLAIWRAGDAAVHAGLAVGRAAPIAGALFSGFSAVLDWQQYQRAKNACMAGGN